MYWLHAYLQTKKIIFHGDFRQFFLTIEMMLKQELKSVFVLFGSGVNRKPGG